MDHYSINHTDIVWIFDEAQLTYEDTGIWLSFVKYQQGHMGGARICAFSSYGSPSTGPEQYSYSHGSPLAELGPQHRVSIMPSKLPFAPSIHSP